jgi:putative Ca2+/H+ antiporter (TMEM165/GDT1 family)
MPGFFLALLASLLASLGGRDQIVMGQLSRSFDNALPLLAPAWLASISSALLAGLAGAWLAPMMPPGGKAMLVAAALALAGVELAWRSRAKAGSRRVPAEPTRSVIAIFTVLFAHQMGDAARFLVFALAAAQAEPALVMAGGAAGGGASLTMAWLERGEGSPWSGRGVRITIAAACLVTACVIAINVLGIA